ncbi:hypothetical protein Cabys_2110 [Caldithrix abyssi DSM 13497]|uniref:Uncharacterized protein n=1 Tax=Caldithrix abyssi DSM 13497 TaxID=880073 RepID=A0A1J1C835_CALAY|nr:hypothetical protein Cabys_2110 [Caldithrix abyssi DSM 13497]
MFVFGLWLRLYFVHFPVILYTLYLPESRRLSFLKWIG